jgi:hypothetical protein
LLHCALPQRCVAGDTLDVTVETSLTPGTLVGAILTGAPNGTPTRYRIGCDPTSFAPIVQVQADGSFELTALPSDTSPWLPGNYRWIILSLDSSGNRTTIAEGEIWIAPDPNGTTVADQRSRSERILANLDALIEGRSLDDVGMYKIGGRELTKMTIRDLVYFRGMYAGKVKRERARRGERVQSSTVPVVFGQGE